MMLCVKQNFVESKHNDLGRLIIDEYKGPLMDVLLVLNNDIIKNFILNGLQYLTCVYFVALADFVL